MLRYRLRQAERAYFPRPDDMNPTLHALLIQRGIDSAEAARRYLAPDASQLRDPMQLSDMPAAVAMIRAALADRAPVCVYGDYDVDGVSASAILGDYLRSLGGKVEVYLPSRHREGYGLNEAAVREIAGRAKLLVTVDCGVTSVALVALAKSLGLSCVVTDHHQPADELPDCPVVNPLLGGYPFPSLCGAGVAFKVVAALGGLEAAMRYVDIAALATVADVVPLADENRAIVKLGLDQINAAPRPGLRALIDAAGLTGKKIGAGNVAFQLAPRLNAGGRIASARRPHELLLSRTVAEAEPIAAELEAENARAQAGRAAHPRRGGGAAGSVRLSGAPRAGAGGRGLERRRDRAGGVAAGGEVSLSGDPARRRRRADRLVPQHPRRGHPRGAQGGRRTPRSASAGTGRRRA